MSGPEIGMEELVLQNRIGEGGIAEVWLAELRGEQVAVKLLRRPDHPGQRRRFLREGQLLQRIRHPAVLRCLAVLDGERPALVLELLHGESLDRRLQRGALGALEAERIAMDLLFVLEHLHALGIVHRDVKPSNVWCGAEGRTVLMDLGLANDPADPLTTTLGEVVGTHAYMAPEQIAGAGFDERSDLYSLGVLLYEVLAGARPYQARGVVGYLAAHRSGRAVRLVDRCPHLPRRITTTVDRLMARDPAARPPSARAARVLLQADAPAPSELRPPAAVGREAVRGALAALLEVGGGVLLYGDEGSGATHAVERAVALAAEQGVEHLRVGAEGAEAALRAALARELDPFVGPVAPNQVMVELGALAAEAGLLLVVEGAERLDAEARALLERIAALPRLAVLATAPTALPLAGLRPLALRPLRPEETRLLVGSMLGTQAVPTGLAMALHQASGGRPGWVVALVRDAHARGLLRRDPETGWTWESASDVPKVPTASLVELPPEARWLFEVLAVAGTALPLGVAAAASGVPSASAALGPLVRAGLVDPPLGDEELVAAPRGALRDELLASLSSAELRARHAAIAACGGAWSERLSALHAAQAQAGGTASVLSLAAADIGTGRPERALALLAGRIADGPAEAARLAGLRAMALLGVGRFSDARRELAVMEASPELAEIGAAVALAGGGWPVEGAVTEASGPMATLLRAETERRVGQLASASATLERPLPGLALEVHRRIALADLHLLGGRVSEGEAALAGVHPSPAGLRVAVASMRVSLALARADLARAAELVRGDWSASLGGDLLRLARMELLVALGAGAEAEALIAEMAGGGSGLPWMWRRRWLRAVALARLGARDHPASVDALFAGAEAARAAGDQVELAFHTGIAGLLTAKEEHLGDAMDRLVAAGAPSLLAALLANGARYTGDPEVLVAAESAAREAGDRLLLLGILFQLRGDGARAEAARIVEDALVGLHGDDRLRFVERREVRWAVGERGESEYRG